MNRTLIALAFGSALLSPAHAGIILSDDFNYADGALTTVAASTWVTHSGTAGQIKVLNGAITLSQTDSEDVNAVLPGGPYTTGVLYASFSAKFTALPTGAGGYFAHFKDEGTSNLKGRIYASTNGAAAGALRLGVTAGGSTPVVFARDISLNNFVIIVVRLDVAAMNATMWVNPASESDTSARSVDATAAAGITRFAFRQSMSSGSGMGVETIDHLIVGRTFEDVFSTSNPPTVRFTNTLDLIRKGDAPVNSFSDFALQPGESITIQARITDPEGRVVNISAPTKGLPPGALWTLDTTSGADLQASFTYKASDDEAGQLVTPTLVAINAVATNTTVWKIYVPSALEQKVTIGEFLANPAFTNTAPHFNPLRRSLPDPLPTEYVPSSSDEYVEIVNLASSDLDLAGWTISDSASMRHKFYESFTLPATSAMIAYGGPRNGYAPNLDVPSSPASENASLDLDDTRGDAIILRNADGNIICRVVYIDATLSTRGSVTRFPDANGVFLPQVWVSTNNVTPGRQFDGRLWSEPAPQLASQYPITVQPEPGGAITLSWTAVAGKFYTLWQTDAIGTPFSPKFYGLTFTNSVGNFKDASAAGAAKRFYWISTP